MKQFSTTSLAILGLAITPRLAAGGSVLASLLERERNSGGSSSPKYCQQVDGVLAALPELAATATDFCGSYLGVALETTVPVTVTATSITTTTAVLTVSSLTCPITGTTTTGTPGTIPTPPQIDSPTTFLEARGTAGTANGGDRQLSSACGCLSLTPTLTASMTVTAPSTVTSTASATTTTCVATCHRQGRTCSRNRDCCSGECRKQKIGRGAYVQTCAAPAAAAAAAAAALAQ
ncbi:hypothetical protein GGR56DRAFT_683646 [Xylariaceae sp. FL0804]|nr:hypothetical protein GGR56DRAFT_683646 [Xylariaceae sp. FL0804]